ncbi:MAG: GntR family transcriptional regulator [Victivallales bacterium]
MSELIELNRTIPVPLYYQLKENLKKSIRRDFAAGDKFYSERQLAEMLSVSRITTNRVVNELVNDKILYRLHGKGTFVAAPQNREKTFNIGFMISRRLEKLDFQGGISTFQRLVYVKSVCAKFGYSVFFLSESEDNAERENLAKLIGKIDGLIILGDVNPELIRFFNKQIPTVIMDGMILDGVDCVLGDNPAGAYENVSYLIKNGHRRIGTIYGSLTVASFRERLDGYKKVLADNGIEVCDELIVKGGGLIENGYRAMETLLALKNPPTAVFASNDIMAIGAMKKITDVGLSIPGDISVTGFDDKELAYPYPPLTTVRFDKAKLAEVSMRHLMAKIDRKSNQATIERIPVELVIRESVANIFNPKNKML